MKRKSAQGFTDRLARDSGVAVPTEFHFVAHRLGLSPLFLRTDPGYAAKGPLPQSLPDNVQEKYQSKPEMSECWLSRTMISKNASQASTSQPQCLHIVGI